MTRRAAYVIACVVLAALHAGLGQAQEDTTALEARAHTLERSVARRPTPRAQCELGFIYFRLARLPDAVQQLDAGILALGHPADTARANRQLLAQCLYSRGRTAEALGDFQRARGAYARSLDVNRTPSVEERARTLDGRPASELGPEERAAASDDGTPVYVIEQIRAASGARWSIATWGGGQTGGLAAVMCTDADCTAAVFDDDRTYNGNGWIDVTSWRLHEGATPFVEIRTHAEAGERMDCCTPRIPTVDEDDLIVCALADGDLECTNLVLVDRIHHYALDATVDDASVTLRLRSGHLHDDPPFFTAPPLNRAVPVLELFASDDDE